MCDEIATDPVAAPLLLGLGVTELSVTPRESRWSRRPSGT
ncbi:hypothetical protein AB0C34_03480 [Nocardia sp. NPDC049220]